MNSFFVLNASLRLSENESAFNLSLFLIDSLYLSLSLFILSNSTPKHGLPIVDHIEGTNCGIFQQIQLLIPPKVQDVTDLHKYSKQMVKAPLS